MAEMSNSKLAVLIDADNAQASILPELIAEISKFGVANVKRAYGDWTTNNLKTWKEHLHKYAIQPIQQFSYTQGKNSTDSSLIIDAMDLLHEGKMDGFCVVSSDSDFTRLANRIREEGLVVYGFGERKTPEPFVSACDKFIYTEVLKKVDSQNTFDESNNAELKTIIANAVNVVAKDDGWAPLSLVGSYINKNIPSFDSRNYGYDRLGKLVRSLNYLELDEHRFGNGSSSVHIYVRIKNS